MFCIFVSIHYAPSFTSDWFIVSLWIYLSPLSWKWYSAKDNLIDSFTKGRGSLISHSSITELCFPFYGRRITLETKHAQTRSPTVIWPIDRWVRTIAWMRGNRIDPHHSLGKRDLPFDHMIEPDPRIDFSCSFGLDRLYFLNTLALVQKKWQQSTRDCG
jgi:hypothetical protein